MYKALVLLISVVGAVSASVLPRGSPYTGKHSGEATFYKPGLGACGKTHRDGDFIAAIDKSLFDTYPGAGPNPNKNPVCGKKVTATHKGKSVTVTVVDRCGAGCKKYDLDLSPAAFRKLAPHDAGRIPITWTWH